MHIPQRMCAKLVFSHSWIDIRDSAEDVSRPDVPWEPMPDLAGNAERALSAAALLWRGIISIPPSGAFFCPVLGTMDQDAERSCRSSAWHTCSFVPWD